jgi:hypothetical protein
MRHAVVQLVEALCYTPEVHGFNSRWCHEIYHWHNPSSHTMTLGLTQSLREMSKKVQASWPWRGGKGIALHILNLGTRRGWVVSTMPRLLYPWDRPSTHCTGGWVSPRAGLDVAKNLDPTGILSTDCPARSQSLYRLSYPAPITEMSTSNNSWADKGGRCIGLTTLPPSCADCFEILEL